MPGDPLAHVDRGQTFDPQAETWNLFADAARAYKRGILGPGGGAGPTRNVSPRVTCWIANNTGYTLPPFSVVKLSTPLGDPVNDPYSFLAYPGFQGITPGSSSDAIAILTDGAQSAAPGNITEGIVGGIVQAAVLMNSPGDQWASPIAGDRTKLSSGSCGPAQILWVAGTTGVQLAILLMFPGNSCSSVADLCTQIANLPVAAAIGTPGLVALNGDGNCVQLQAQQCDAGGSSGGYGTSGGSHSSGASGASGSAPPCGCALGSTVSATIQALPGADFPLIGLGIGGGSIGVGSSGGGSSGAGSSGGANCSCLFGTYTLTYGGGYWSTVVTVSCDGSVSLEISLSCIDGTWQLFVTCLADDDPADQLTVQSGWTCSPLSMTFVCTDSVAECCPGGSYEVIITT